MPSRFSRVVTVDMLSAVSTWASAFVAVISSVCLTAVAFRALLFGTASVPLSVGQHLQKVANMVNAMHAVARIAGDTSGSQCCTCCCQFCENSSTFKGMCG